MRKAGGWAALAEALIYVMAFIFYGAVLGPPGDTSTAGRLAFLAEHRIGITLVTLIGYVGFGALLAVLVAALHEHMKRAAPMLAQLAAVFGLVWVGLVIAAGMISNIGLGAALKLAGDNPEGARSLWLAVSTVVEGIGGGNEIVGGLWVLLISMAGLQAGILPRPLNWLGLLVGVTGIATVYPLETLTELFGISQIAWFTWLSLHLLKPARPTANLPQATGSTGAAV
ncbi:MAG: hypothetical protein K0R43_518 [Pseudoduganella sp.]|jgi:hypothetical protein|nr:hypothetical protein [Pseudoduganella sp.]